MALTERPSRSQDPDPTEVVGEDAAIPEPDAAATANPDTSPLPQIIVSPQADRAELLLPMGISPQTLSVAFCLAMVEQAGVEITNQAMETIGHAVEQYMARPRLMRKVIARGTDRVDGRDGTITWHVDPPIEEGNNQRQSHYERSVFITVAQGQVIGQITEPTLGEDGRDVLGRTIPAVPGKPAELHLDETIIRDAAGQLIAQIQGLLVRQNGAASVQQIMQIDDFVDFSTGNIDFIGDVIVMRGVRDCFEVKSGGNVEVHGMIEAANIKCKGDLVAQGGFAGRERGTAIVGRNLVSRYLDNISGEVRGDLQVEREIVNCEFIVHGNLNVPNGVIVGGRIVVAGKVDIGQLGSDAAINTQIVMGAVPRLDGLAEELYEIVDRLQSISHKIDEQEQELLDYNTLSHEHKERQTELTFLAMAAYEPLSKARKVLKKLLSVICSLRVIRLNAEKTLHPGTELHIAGQTYRIHTAVPGPMRIFQNENGVVCFARNHGAPRPLRDICEVGAA